MLNSDLWVEKICGSSYMDNILIDLIPSMSSDICDIGSASASGHYNNNYPYKAFDKIGFVYPPQSQSDFSQSTAWYYEDLNEKPQTAYIQFIFKKPVRICKIEIFYNTYTTQDNSNYLYKCKVEYGNGDFSNSIGLENEIYGAMMKDNFPSGAGYNSLIINKISDRIKHIYTNNPNGYAFPAISEFYIYGRIL